MKEKEKMIRALEQKRIRSQSIYRGSVFNVRKDEARMTNGRLITREVVEHRGGVAIAMEKEDGTFFMVRQWRYAYQGVLLEYPAGKKENGEEAIMTAQREIREETGYEGTNWIYFGHMVPTPAYDEEMIDLFYAKCGPFRGQQPDADEELLVTSMSLDAIRQAIIDGKIIDAKTVALTFLVQEKIKRGK